jgi:sporulation protein YlmC with PRC-barrel domain
MMVMGDREIGVHDLLGRVVRTAAGRPVGRIEDLRAEPEGEDYVVREVIIGELGLRARLFAMAAQLPTLRALGLVGVYRIRAIPWEWLDLSDPERPRFLKPEEWEEVEDGKKMEEGKKTP